MPEPDFSPTQAHPTVNSVIFDRIRHGKIHPRPAIQDISDQTVHFTDGSSAQYDVIIAATGYKISFPFFDTDLINWENASHVPLYLRIFHPVHPSLFFIGLIQPQGCIWTLTEVQSRLTSQLLSGKIQLPSNWREQADAEDAFWARHFIARPRHSLEVQYHPYRQQLLRMLQGKSVR